MIAVRVRQFKTLAATAMFAVTVTAASVFAEGGNNRIAVYVTGHPDNNVLRVLSTDILSGITKNSQYTAIEKSADFFNQAQKKPMGEAEAVNLSRLHDADFLCFVNIMKALDEYYLSAKIDDIRIGEAVTSGNVSSPLKTMDDIVKASAGIVNTLLGSQTETPASTEAAASQPETPPAENNAVNYGNNAAAANSAPARTEKARVDDFTAGERWGTFFLNDLIPGLGSGAIMHDNTGAWIQVGLFSGGLLFILTDSGGGSFRSFGVLLLISNYTYNIIRSASYRKPAPKTAAGEILNGLNLAALPDENGNFKGYLLYNRSF